MKLIKHVVLDALQELHAAGQHVIVEHTTTNLPAGTVTLTIVWPVAGEREEPTLQLTVNMRPDGTGWVTRVHPDDAVVLRKAVHAITRWERAKKGIIYMGERSAGWLEHGVMIYREVADTRPGMVIGVIQREVGAPVEAHS